MENVCFSLSLSLSRGGGDGSGSGSGIFWLRKWDRAECGLERVREEGTAKKNVGEKLKDKPTVKMSMIEVVFYFTGEQQ